MTITFADVDEILRIIDQFPAAEVRYEHGDLKLYIKRAHAAGAAAQPPAFTPPAATAPVLPAAAPVAAVPTSVAAAPQPAASRKAASVVHSGQIAVEAPLMGVFYAAPAPGAQPFVTPGVNVDKGTDLGIIEVMKVMNLIKAPCAGTVTDIVAENGAMVEIGQSLMWIKPSAERQ